MKSRNEGITLIALVIMIVILVVISAVAIRALTGNENLLETTTAAADSYKVSEYKEMISQEIARTVQANSMKGNGTTLGDIENALETNTTWVKEATAYTDNSVTNEDILVTTENGYVYQIYYNDIYGVYYVEFVGTGSEDEFPTLTAKYDKMTTSIEAKASGNVSKLELIFRGEVIETVNSSSLNKVITQSGWYIIKVSTEKGNLRYAWLKVTSLSGKIEPPLIFASNGTHGGDGWYRSSLEVTIRSNDEAASKIYYTINNGTVQGEERWTEVNGHEAIIPISSPGRTIITAYAEDTLGNISDTNSYTAKYDNVSPTITNPPKITSNKPQVNGWYVSGLEIEIEGTDESSGISGYYYMVKGEGTEWRRKEISEKLVIGENDREGITEIVVKTVDAAGNESGQITINIPKDTVKPTFMQALQITEENSAGFTVNAYATDPEPSSTINGDKITYDCYAQEVNENGTITGTKIKVGEGNEAGIFKVTGLSPKKNYNIEVIARDPAGNETTTSIRGATKGELLAPRIDISGDIKDGYYTGDVRITITDTASEETTSGARIKYTQNGVDSTQTGRSYSYTITADGTYRIVAYMQDSTGETSAPSNEITFTRDTSVPNTPTITFSGTTGENGYYKGNITMTITPGTDSGSGVKGIGYRIVRGSTTVVSQTTKDTTTATNVYTGSTDGTYTVYAYTIDNAGNRSAEVNNSASKDSTVPNGPTVNPTTSANSNGWYKADVQVNISAGADSTSGAYKLKYSTNGGTSYTTTAAGVTSTTITVSAEGTNSIVAYTIDKAGNVSTNTGTATVKLDKTIPSSATLSLSSTTTSAIAVSASGADALSGVSTYRIDYKKSSVSTWTNGTASTTKTRTCSGLSSGTSYNFRVIVADNAGNERTSSTYTWSTKTASLPITTANDIGKYVDYKPTSGSYTASTTYGAYSTNQTFSTETGMKWRIWKVDSSNLYLISDRPTNSGGYNSSGQLYLTGALGYNNGVTLLDNICSNCYKNSSYSGMTARSLKISDIEGVTKFAYTGYSNYNASPYTYSGSYPYIWGQYESSSIANRNTAYSLTTSTTTSSSSFTPRGSYWYKQYSSGNASTEWSNTKYYELVCSPTNNTSYYPYYWLSSRYVYLYSSSYCYFGLQYVRSGGVSGSTLYNSYGSTDSPSGAVRPLVSIPLTSCIISTSSDSNYDYHITNT